MPLPHLSGDAPTQRGQIDDTIDLVNANTSALALKAPIADAHLTGLPTAPTMPPGDDAPRIATTEFVTAAILVESARAETAEAGKAPLVDAHLTGLPTAPTMAPGDISGRIATTEFVAAAVSVVTDDRGAALSAETTRAEAAEATLAANIAAETTRAAAAEATKASASALATETAVRIAAIATKADASALASETSARIDAVAAEKIERLAADSANGATIAALVAALPIETMARTNADIALAAIMVGSSDRPGDNPGRFTATLNGWPEDCPPLSSAGVASSTTGRIYRLTGSGIVARRDLISRDPSRVVAIRITARGIADPTDPLGDAAQPKLRFLTAAGAFHSDMTLATWSLTAGQEQTFSGTIGGAGIAWPDGAYHAREHLEFFGLDGVRAAVAFARVDITDAAAYSPDLTALSARVTAVEDAVTTLDPLAAGEANGTATLTGAGIVERTQLPVTVSQMRRAISAGLSGGVKGLLRFISSDPEDAVNSAFFGGGFVPEGGVLATAISAYLQAAVDADPPGLAMSSGTAATQMTTLFTDARALAD